MIALKGQCLQLMPSVPKKKTRMVKLAGRYWLPIQPDSSVTSKAALLQALGMSLLQLETYILPGLMKLLQVL